MSSTLLSRRAAASRGAVWWCTSTISSCPGITLRNGFSTGRAWNERSVRSFLASLDTLASCSASLGCQYFRPDVLAEVLPGYPDHFRDGGGSLWIQRAL